MTNIDINKCKVTYNVDDSVFTVQNEQNEFEYSSLLKVKPGLDVKKYDCYLLHNKRKEVSENSIYKVYFDKIRGGWIFPIQALLSIEHDYSEDEYFLRYAYLGLYYLLSTYTNEDIENESSIDTKYSSEDHILLIDHDNIKGIDNFSINNYIVSLFKCGYGFNEGGNLISDEVIISDKNMHLSSTSYCFSDNIGIKFLFTELIEKNESEFSLFYVLYQLIELLISKVLILEFKKQVFSIDWDETNLFDKNEAINKSLTEKSRINALVNQYSNPEHNKLESLSEACKDFLISSKYDTETTLNSKSCVDNFYRVRCCLVHSLYKYDRSTSLKLSEVNKCFLEVLMDILLTFKE